MAGPGSAKTSILVVEDDTMIRMMIVDMVEDLGCTVAAEAGDVDEALRLIGTTTFDVAILDVNLNGKVVLPVAEALREQGRPFVFSTGYGAQGLPEEFRDAPILQKPFQIDALKVAIDKALGT